MLHGSISLSFKIEFSVVCFLHQVVCFEVSHPDTNPAGQGLRRLEIVSPFFKQINILGAVTLDLLPMGNLGVMAWVGFTLGYDRLPICGYTLVNYPRGR